MPKKWKKMGPTYSHQPNPEAPWGPLRPPEAPKGTLRGPKNLEILDFSIIVQEMS